ncbi:MAG TPA: sigma-70 family RNA polymerase sigma factor [Niabella sp.]|nr:sigma-70 family RNA polymerase sigma factor [Niabella sp.]
MLENGHHNEKELLTRISMGDEGAFAQLVHTYEQLVRSFIKKHVQRSDWLGEIVDDVFLQLWQNRAGITEIQDFNRYLFVLCRNKAINAMKKELREIIRNRNWYQDYQANQPVSRSDKEAHLTLLENAVQTLSERQREVWVMSKVKGLTYEQISNTLHIGKETVKSHLQAANHSIKSHVLKHAGSLLLAGMIISICCEG